MAYKNIDTIIINTACNLFIEKGYANVSVNEICSACSITKPTLYYHFKSKEDIIYAYFRSIIEGCYDIIENISAPQNPVLNSDTNATDISEKDIENQTTNTENICINGKYFVIKSFNVLFSVITSKGYDMTQNFISSCLSDISKSIIFSEKTQKLIINYIASAQADCSICNTSTPDDLYVSLCHIFSGYLLHWCMHNGLLEPEDSLENAIKPLFY